MTPLPPPNALQAAFLINGLRDYKAPQSMLDAIANPAQRNSFNVVLDAWGLGCVELFDTLANRSGLVHQLAERSWQILSAAGEDGFPGVFEYDVTEAVGSDIAAGLVHTPAQTRSDEDFELIVQRSLYNRAADFFRAGGCDCLPALHKAWYEILPLVRPPKKPETGTVSASGVESAPSESAESATMSLAVTPGNTGRLTIALSNPPRLSPGNLHQVRGVWLFEPNGQLVDVETLNAISNVLAVMNHGAVA